jgi:ABC-type nitrate/sulfonate/bicarbonate transport system ATPase subunit
MKSPALAVEHVSATYVEHGQTLPVLDDLSFEVAAGECVALLGPSGSGKTTLLDIVSGLLSPDSGRIMLEGDTTTAPERLGRFAYMHQRDLLLPWRNAVENAALGLEVQRVPKSEARARAAARFPEFGLAGFERHYPAQLSGGMRQRVAVLRTLLTGQSTLLLDEPFGALDAMTRATSQAWLQTMLAGDQRTVLLVTHDVEEAVYLADRVLVLTERPGHIAQIDRILEPRPRPRSFIATEIFAGYKRRLLERLGLLDSELS